MRCFTGQYRKVARLKRAAKSAGITSSPLAPGAKQVPNLRMSTSWREHHPSGIHERFLGRTQRDQAIGNLATCVSRMVARGGSVIRSANYPAENLAAASRWIDRSIERRSNKCGFAA